MYLITDNNVKAKLNTWTKICEENMPTLHVFESIRVIVISNSSEVLIGPVRLIAKSGKFIFERPYMDTMCVYHCDTMKMMATKFPSRQHEPEQYFDGAVLTVLPFAAWITELGLNIGVQMLVQFMNLNLIQGDATMVSFDT